MRTGEASERTRLGPSAGPGEGRGKEQIGDDGGSSSAGSHANWSSLVNNAAEGDSKHHAQTFHSSLGGRAQLHRPGPKHWLGPSPGPDQ